MPDLWSDLLKCLDLPTPVVGRAEATETTVFEGRSFATLTVTGPPQFEFWMRTPDVDPELAPALTAYATDLTLIGTALRSMDGLGQRGNGTQFIAR